MRCQAPVGALPAFAGTGSADAINFAPKSCSCTGIADRICDMLYGCIQGCYLTPIIGLVNAAYRGIINLRLKMHGPCVITIIEG